MNVRRLILPALVVLMALVAIPACDRLFGDDEPPVGIDVGSTERVGGIEIYRDVPFRTVDGIELLLDVYLPGEDDAPGILFAHGGGWSAGGKSGFTRGGVALARAGFVAIAPQYRLAPPGGRWHAPAPVQDLRSAVVWYRDHARSFDADPDRLGAIGASAGGNLALLLGSTGEPGRDRVDAVVSLSGPTNLLAAAAMGADEDGIVENYIGCPLERCEALWRAMSPLFQVDPQTAPTYLINSETELVPAAQARALTRKMQSEGITVRVDIVPGTVHGLRLAPEALPEILAFLEDHLET